MNDQRFSWSRELSSDAHLVGAFARQGSASKDVAVSQQKDLSSTIPDPTPTWDSASRAFTSFLRAVPEDARVVLLHDFDADGLAAAIVLQTALERAGRARPLRQAVERQRSPWAEPNRVRVAASDPAALIVLDLASRAKPLVPGVPTCFIDHHRPGGVAPGDTLISAYPWSPPWCTALIAHRLAGTVAGVDDLGWITALGILNDLGDKARFPELEEARRRHTSWRLREVTSLINAARRSPDVDPDLAARVLQAHPGPRELLSSRDADVEVLREARKAVQAELARAKKVAPVFASGIALIAVRSRYQIHPLVAQIWRSRLPSKYVVFAANDGYLPGRVVFSARSAPGVSAIDLIRSLLGEADDLGQGHEQASGGVLPLDVWHRLLERLGFTGEPKIMRQT